MQLNAVRFMFFSEVGAIRKKLIRLPIKWFANPMNSIPIKRFSAEKPKSDYRLSDSNQSFEERRIASFKAIRIFKAMRPF